MGCTDVCIWTRDFLTTYYAPRHMKVQSKILRLTFLFIVIAVMTIFLSSLANLKLLYVKECPVLGAVNLKSKGHVSTVALLDEDFKDEIIETNQTHWYKRIWDHSDLIYPPHGGDGQDGSFIAVTNVVIIANQTRSTCPSVWPCYNENHVYQCMKGRPTKSVFGIMTGNCLNTTIGERKEVCEVAGWCPVEPDYKTPLKLVNGRHVALFPGVKDFTIFVKNSVEFPGCGKQHSTHNIIPGTNLANCRFDINEKKKPCPIFRLEDVITLSKEKFNDNLTVNGGVFRIEIHWDCNLFWGKTAHDCVPRYNFERLDETETNHSLGFNFVIPIFHEEHRRSLVKMFGIKVLVVTTGHGEQFELSVLVLNAGALVGLLSIAPLFCELLFDLLSFLSSKCRLCRKLVGDFSEIKKVRHRTSHLHLDHHMSTVGIVTPTSSRSRRSSPGSASYPWESTNKVTPGQDKTNDQPKPSEV